MSVIPFRSAGDIQADQMIDAMCAIVDGHPTLTGINACLQTLAILIVGYGAEHGDAAGLAERCGTMLSGAVAGLASDMESAAEQVQESAV